MGNIHEFYPTRMQVGTDDGFGHLGNVFDAEGFRCKLEESDSVIWQLFSINNSTTDVVAVYCKPFTTGPWQIIKHLSVPVGANNLLSMNWRADNDDHFFFLEYSDGNTIPGGDANSTWATGTTDTPGNEDWADMRWKTPSVSLALRWHAP